MYILYCVFVRRGGAHKGRASKMSDICPPAHPRLFLLYPVYMQAFSSLTVSPLLHGPSVSFSLSCFSHSAVLSLSVCVAALPISSGPACPIEPVKKRGVLLLGPPGVVSDGEAVPVVLCIQWKEQSQRGVDCISWASSFIKTLLILPPPSHWFSWSLECTQRLQELQVADGGRS